MALYLTSSKHQNEVIIPQKRKKGVEIVVEGEKGPEYPAYTYVA
jgi:hypothetical protein